MSRTSYDNLYLFLRSHTNVRLGQTDGPGAVRVRHQSRYVEARLYVGGSEQGSPISQLRQIAPSQVQSLKILPPDEASSRYGGYGRIAIIDLILK